MSEAAGDGHPPTKAAGWGVLHLFYRLTPTTDGAAIAAAVKRARDDDHQVVAFAVLGHKADLGFACLGPDMWRLRALQTELAGAGLEAAWSYVSLTEVSEYAAGMPDASKQARLYPKLPPEGMEAICFYPMSKRRGESHNWFLLPFEERLRLMRTHGGVGRQFAGRVLQLITGSTGLDDWEWGVTLFARHPDDLKDVVYTMRFDEASARYAEFGPFYVGMVGEIDDLLERMGRR